jgi:hypothetical protein
MTAALLAAADPAIAFEELPEAPTPDPLQVAPDNSPALDLQTPSTAAPVPPEAAEKSGAKVFGLNLLPKLDFGLELMYGEDDRLEMQQGASSGTSPYDNGEVTVLGKFKHQF